MEEAALLERAMLGENDAWQALISRHDRRVVVQLLGRGVPLWRAKELAQEAWMRLLQQARAGRLTSLSLPGLAVAQALFLWREDARRPSAAAPMAELPDAAAAGPDPEGHLLASERLSRANALLRHCSPSAQEVFALYYREPHLAAAEVATRVGLSTQRVRQILCEVRKKLRDELLEDAG